MSPDKYLTDEEREEFKKKFKEAAEQRAAKRTARAKKDNDGKGTSYH